MENFNIILSKVKTYSLEFISMTIGFFAPIGGILLSVGIMIIFDTIVGIWKAKKLGEKITTRRFSSIIVKFCIYQFAVLSFFVMDYFILNEIIKNFFNGDYLVTKIMALILIGTECFSIDESIKEVKGVGLIDNLKKMLRKGKEIKEDIDKIKRGN